MSRFIDKVVLVVGSTAGIGKATVERFLNEGAKVAFVDIADIGHEQEEVYKQTGFDAFYIKADATDEEDVKNSVKKVVEKYGRIDIAINVVGGQVKADPPTGVPFHETSTEGWLGTKKMSDTSIYLYMREEISVMLKQGGGIIANTASTAGLKPVFSSGASPVYSSSKASVIHLTKYAAIQYAKNNIRINAVSPGAVLTEKLKTSLSDEQRQAIIEKVQPNARFIEPEEIAAAFAYLCSDDAKSVTGVILPVDGGIVAT